MPDSADLLEETDALKALLIASEASNQRKDERIARLEKLVAAFRQAAFGRRSEKSDPDQFELALEDLETAIAGVHAEEDAEDRAAKRLSRPRAANRGSLPRHLPRIEEVIEPESLTCACGGCLHCIGEDGEAIAPLVRAMAERAAGRGPSTVPRHRDPPPEVCLPLLHLAPRRAALRGPVHVLTVEGEDGPPPGGCGSNPCQGQHLAFSC